VLRAAAAPLMVYMKKKTSLNLTKPQIGTGNILAVAANIVARFCTGCAAHPAPNPLAAAIERASHCT
jgi:nitrate/nitrite transporter NarK